MSEDQDKKFSIWSEYTDDDKAALETLAAGYIDFISPNPSLKSSNAPKPSVTKISTTLSKTTSSSRRATKFTPCA